MSELDPAQILVAIAAGDQDAATAFDRQFRAQLRRFLHGRVPDQDQDDVLQRTMVAAFNAIAAGGFAGRSQVGTWLVGILKKKVLDYWDLEARKSTPLVEGRVLLEKNQFQTCLGIEQRIDVQSALERLPKLHRAVFLLNIREGLSTEEIGAAMGLAKGTAGRILWESKRMLRDQLSPKKLSSGTDK